jgi:hypothetical protein
MTKKELHDMVTRDIQLFMDGVEFKVSEFFIPAVWLKYSGDAQKKIAKMFETLVLNGLKETVSIKQKNTDLIIQTYVKHGKKTVQKKVNVFPNEPVSIKRNERGNA